MEKHSLKGTSLLLLTLALGLGTFIQILDTSIANVSIPAIAGDLGVALNNGTWIITSFAVSNAIVLPLTGWLSHAIGRVRLFVFSTAGFAMASLLCGLAWNLPALIVFRTLQGAVAGCLIPLSQSLLLMYYPEEKRGLAMGFWSMIVIVAPLAGPVLGGWITDDFGWSWIFYINVPIGLFSSFLTWNLIGDSPEEERQRTSIDYVGLFLLIIGVGCLQVMLDKGNELDWFSSSAIVTLAIISAISLSFFIAWNAYSAYPIVDFSFFKQRNFLFGTIVSGFGFMIFFGTTVLLPLWLQSQMGYTAFLAGIAIIPIGIIPLLVGVFLGKYMHLFDLRFIAMISFLTYSVTFFWFSHFNTQVSLGQLMLPRLVQGIGAALFIIPLITLALSQIPHHALTSASGVFNFVRLLAGGGIGTAIFVNVWSNRETLHHSQLAETVTPFSPATAQTLAIFHDLGLEGESATELLNTVVSQQSFMLATNDIFFLSGWGFMFLIPFVWLCKSIPKKDLEPNVMSE